MSRDVNGAMDCLLIGYNEPDFNQYEAVLRSMGQHSGAYKDLNLNFVELENKKYPPVGLLNEVRKRVTGKESHLNCAEPLSLAVAYLSSYLEKRGLRTDYINVFQSEKDKLASYLKQDVKTVAITTTFYVSPMPLIEIITFIKKHNTKAKIIIGGPFVANQFASNDEITLEFLLHSIGGDVYVNSSQGEYALYRIVDAYLHNKSFDDIDNIAYKKGKGFVITSSSFEDNDLDENMIDWSMFDSSRLGSTVQLRTARGCAYSCSFCGYPIRAGKYTYTRIETVEKELNYIKSLGTVKNLAFIDDTFNVPLDRFKELLRMMIRNQYNFNWFSYLRCQHMDEETVQLMKESGCKGVFLGIESGSPQILENMNKHATVDKYREGIRLLNEAGILSFASFIVGFPGETDKTVQQTIDFIEETKPTFYRVQMWYCDPVTPIFQRQDQFKITGQSFEWSHATMNSKQASEWIDKIFLTVQHSIWLAQYNFDFWILPNLLGHGMSVENFTEFVNVFNALLREKFNGPMNMSEKTALMKRLNESCTF